MKIKNFIRNNLLGLALMAVLVGVPVTAWALNGSRNMEFALKAVEKCYFYNVWTAVTETDLGSDGLVAYQTVDTGGTNNITFLATNIHQLPYPARLGVQLADITANDTLTCTSVTLVGKDQFGKPISETVSSVTETAQNTNNVFLTLTAVSAVGCSDGTDAGDSLAVFTSQFIGLGVKIRSASDVEMACKKIAAGTSFDCATIATSAAATTVVSSADARRSYTFDASSAAFDGAAAVDDDTVCFRIRPSF